MATARVDALLTTKEAFALDRIDALDDADRAEAIALAFDPADDPRRLRAIGIVILFDIARALDAIRQVLDENNNSSLMAGVVTVAAAAGQAAIPLAASVATSSDQQVAMAAWLTLQKISAAENLETLSSLARRVSGIVFDQALFALSVIAYRSGVSGFELPVPAFEDRLDFDADVEIVTMESGPAGEDDFTRLARQVGGELYMLTLSLDATRGFVCAGSRMLLALDAAVLASVPARLLEAPALAGLIALSDPFGLTYAVQHLVLTWPDGQGGVNVAVHQPQGVQVYFGSGEIEPDGQFAVSMQAIARPGAVPIVVTAVAGPDTIDFAQANSAAEISELTPKLAFEADSDG